MNANAGVHSPESGQAVPSPPRRVLIAAAVEGESEAIRRGLSRNAAAPIDVIAVGVGPAAAAANTAARLALAPDVYDLVISAGIGGGFAGQASLGELVLANEVVAADLGAETEDGFLSLDELGFGSSRATVSADWNDWLLAALRAEGLSPRLAPIITVSAATGTAQTAQARARFVPGAAAEGMEGYGVATAAGLYGIAAAELRAVSNSVGPRDRAAWRIGDALAALESACGAIAAAFEYIPVQEDQRR